MGYMRVPEPPANIIPFIVSPQKFKAPFAAKLHGELQCRVYPPLIPSNKGGLREGVSPAKPAAKPNSKPNLAWYLSKIAWNALAKNTFKL
jgi:hypothetical protein